MSVYILSRNIFSDFGISRKKYLVSRTYNGRTTWTNDPNEAKKFKDYSRALEMKRIIRYIDTEIIDYTNDSFADLITATLTSLCQTT